MHTLRAEIDYGLAEAHTTMGLVGVKVWIFKGERVPQQKIVVNNEFDDLTDGVETTESTAISGVAEGEAGSNQKPVPDSATNVVYQSSEEDTDAATEKN